MNIAEACKILGINPGCSKEEAKKAFRQKAAQYHPDRNKDDNAEQMFKDINSAYQLIEKYGTTQPQRGFNEDFEIRMQDFFSGSSFFQHHFNYNRNNDISPIIVPIEISFDLAVLGGQKDITYERTVKCDYCVGQRNKCDKCNGTGVQKSTDTLRVVIPSGVNNGMRLVIRGKGNYINGLFGNIIVVISVIPDHDLQMQDKDVVSVIDLTLLESLTGTKKRVRTVKGDRILSFKPKTKHKDTIRISGFGVPPMGAHIVVVNVSYPEDVSDLIQILEKEKELEEITGEQRS